MHIKFLIEAGTPVIAGHDFDLENGGADQLVSKIRALGAGKALEEILANPEKMLYRGLRGSSAVIIHQDTLASTRSSENTKNYVTWLTEVLPSWKRANILPRSKIVSCTSSFQKASEYGRCYVVLPAEGSQCAYTGAHDFWDAFEGVNHVYGNTESIPAINDAFEKQATKLVTSAAGMVKMCKDLADDLESGAVREESLNKEMKALLQSDDSTYDVLEILDNLLDPSHMRTSFGGELLSPGNFQEAGEEVQIGGDIVFVEYTLFMSHFNRKKAEVPEHVFGFITEGDLQTVQTSGMKPINGLQMICITNPYDKKVVEKVGGAVRGNEKEGVETLAIRIDTTKAPTVKWNDVVLGFNRPGDVFSTRDTIPAAAITLIGRLNTTTLRIEDYKP